MSTMRISSTLFALALFFGGSDAGPSGSKSKSVRDSRRMQAEFMTAMHANPNIAAAAKMGRRKLNNEERQRRLRKTLVSKSRMLYNKRNKNGRWSSGETNEQNSWGWFNNNQANSRGYYDQSDSSYYTQEEKDYQHGGQYNYNNVEYDSQGQYSGGQWNGNGVNGKYLNNNGYNDDAQQPDDDNWRSQYNLDFDMTSKAFKYAGCASIKSFDEEFAQESDSKNPLSMQTYVTFRLCPENSCNKYNLMGCSKNYGEYVVELETYLEAIMEYYSQRYEEYCEYCLTCDSEVQVEASEMLQQCYFEKTMEEMSTNNDDNNSNSNSNNYNNNYNNYDSAYNGGNGFQNYQTSGGNRQLVYNYNNNNDDGSNTEESSYNGGNGNNYGASKYYTQSMYDGKGYWVNGEFQEGYWKDGLFYQYDQNVLNTIENCQKNKNEGNYQDYDCNNLNDCDEQNQMDYPPCDDDVCGDYYTYCTELNGNMRNQSVYNNTDFLGCAPIESYSFMEEADTDDPNDYKEGEGIMFYIGPHCGNNGYSLTLGVFSDENCNNYIGDQVSVSQVLGFRFDDNDEIFQLPEECLSCDGMEDTLKYNQENYDAQGQTRYDDDYMASKQMGYYSNEENGGQENYYGYNPDYQYNANYQYNPNKYYVNDNGEAYEDDDTSSNQRWRKYGSDGSYYSTVVKAPDTDEDGVVAMCSTLYKESAQCNKNLKSYKTYSQFMTRYELAVEERYCNFIDNIIYGSYDSSGDIVLGGGLFDITKWRNSDYKQAKMTLGQAVLLTMSAFTCAVMIAVIVYMKKLVNRKHLDKLSPWMPKEITDLDGMGSAGSYAMGPTGSYIVGGPIIGPTNSYVIGAPMGPTSSYVGGPIDHSAGYEAPPVLVGPNVPPMEHLMFPNGAGYDAPTMDAHIFPNGAEYDAPAMGGAPYDAPVMDVAPMSPNGEAYVQMNSPDPPQSPKAYSQYSPNAADTRPMM